MGYILKLKLLLWKNFLIRRRNRLRFIAELLYPLLLFFIIVLQRPSAEKVHVPECHHAENALPSSGQIPFLHSFVCRAQNQCYAKNGTLYKDSGSNPFCDLGKSWGTKDLQRFARSTKDKGKTELSPEFRGYSFRKTVDPDEPKECSDVSSTLSYLTNGALNWATAKPFFRGKILYYPETAATTAVMRRVNDTFNAIMDLDALSHLLPQGQDYMITSFKKCIDQQKVQAVTAESALKEAWALEPNNNLWALVNFEDHGEDKLAPFVKYKIRMAADRLPRTSAASDNPSMGAPSTSTAANKFITHGFAYLQDLIDEAILEQHTNRTGTARPGRILKQFPEPERIVDSLAAMLSQLLPLIMVLAWVYTFSQMAKSVVLEKQERVKEVLAVMGLGRGVQWAGWMLEGLCSAVVTCILLSVLLKYGKLTENSDVIILLLLLVSFVVAMLSFSLLVASFFSNAAIVGPAASVVYFLTYLAYQLVQKQGGPDPTYGQVVGASLLANVALAQGMLVLGQMEESGEGIQWSNINKPPGPGQPATVAACIGMLWLDAAIYAVLTWYIENVFPGEYGVPKPFLFFLDKSYWFAKPDENSPPHVSSEQVPAGNFEAAPEGAIVGVAIENLTKVFGKKKAAVNGLNLNFYQDQINCFLGHNGAGKTTTISMLTGLYTPTSGTARLNGKDIRHDMDAIRTSMGVCPQHNVLFSSLTVEEHLLFFGRIKGVDEKVLKDEIDGMLSEMGLEEKRTSFADTLSGGMKRKLSVGMAFVGGSSVVFLDEPTAGVDPFSRRGIWDLLVRLRQGRTMILTTHFMDEADLLGDRIAIMSEGRLQCCGSSVFLKERLGSGYHLTVEWQLDKGSEVAVDRKALLLQEVLSVVPSARPRRVDGADSDDSQVVYTLPDRHDVAAITALLERLDHQRDALGIASYAISDTSLEEIFLKVAEKKESDGSQSDVLALEDDDETTTGKMLAEPVSGGRLLLQQYVSLAVKRFHYVRRDLKGLFTQLVLPAFFVMLALALSPNLNNGSTVEVVMRPDLLGKPVVSFVKQDQGSTTWGAKYLASMLKDGVGTALVGSDDTKKLPSLRSDTVPDHACTNSPPGNSTRDWTLPSGELYYDATGTALEDWLVSTYQNCRKNRFGGVSYGASYPLKGFSKADTVKVWFDGKTAAVSADVPAYLNTINNVILRASLPDGTNTREYGIETSNWPLPDNPDDDKDKVDAFEVVVVLSSAITVIFAMSFVPASFVMYLVEERMGQSKHLQLVSGLRPYIYWLQSYTWDLVSFIVSEFLVILIFVAYQTPMYTSGSNVVALICLIFMYGVSCTPMLYLFSWFFRIPSMAFLVLSTGNLLVGMATTVTIMVMKITSPDSVDVVEGVFLVLPQYCLGQGLMNMAMNHFKTKSMEAMGYEGDSPMTWDVTGKYLVAMAVAAAVLVCAVFLAEQSTHWWHFLQQSSSDEEVKPSDVGGEAEEDVLRERQRVANGEADGGMLVLKRLTKRYKRGAAPAVAGVSLGVERGQCFGLLGLNGAGKTSIFKMLTGDTLISGGDALVDGRSVRGDMDSVRRLTGYCPQFDALIPLLSVREHLVLYSGLRGVEPRQRPAAVRRAIDMLDLGAHEDKQAKALSGGNKRKLSAAIALVGDPLLLYMDEPTTSMDPCARRFVWQRVRRVVAAGRSVLLTSHSMEECEALCSRLTIMVNGRLTCLGSPQHLKHRYGSGYIAIIRCPVARVEEAKSLLLQRLPGGVIVESHLNQVKMQFPPELPLVRIFRSLDETRINGFVSDYSVSQTTLEDVFMRFARAQKAEAT